MPGNGSGLSCGSKIYARGESWERCKLGLQNSMQIEQVRSFVS
jgi:hypothetical protein